MSPEVQRREARATFGDSGGSVHSSLLDPSLCKGSTALIPPFVVQNTNCTQGSPRGKNCPVSNEPPTNVTQRGDRGRATLKGQASSLVGRSLPSGHARERVD